VLCVRRRLAQRQHYLQSVTTREPQRELLTYERCQRAYLVARRCQQKVQRVRSLSPSSALATLFVATGSCGTVHPRTREHRQG